METTESIALEIQRLAARMRLEAQERGEASSLSIALMAAAAHQMVLECEDMRRRKRSGGGGAEGHIIKQAAPPQATT
jgi:hypothetical protein